MLILRKRVALDTGIFLGALNLTFFEEVKIQLLRKRVALDTGIFFRRGLNSTFFEDVKVQLFWKRFALDIGIFLVGLNLKIFEEV